MVREALGAVATPERADELLLDALARGCELSVPEDPVRLRAWVTGAFFEVLRETLGLGTAEAVIDQIGLVLVALDTKAADEDEGNEISRVRASVPSAPRAPADMLGTRKHAIPQRVVELEPEPVSQPHEEVFESGEILAAAGNQRPTDPVPGMVPIVLLASRDRATLIELRDGLTGGLDVVSVDDPIALLDALHAMPALAVVVIDARNPSVQPATMAAMAPDLPRGVQVLLWGVTPEIESEINALGSETFNWVGCDARTPPEEVAFLCVTMLRDLS